MTNAKDSTHEKSREGQLHHDAPQSGKVTQDHDTGFLFCPRCGQVILGGGVNAFCPQCGHRFCPSCSD